MRLVMIASLLMLVGCKVSLIGSVDSLAVSALSTSPADTATPNKFAVTVTTASFNTLTCGGPFTVTSQDSTGTPVNATSTVTVDLSQTDGAHGVFYSDVNCHSTTTTATLTEGTSTGTFYYKDATESETPTLTATDHAGVFTAGTVTVSIHAPIFKTYVYTANYGDSAEIAAFSMNTTTGALTTVSDSSNNPKSKLGVTTYNTGNSPWGVVADPSSKYLYVANEVPGTLSRYSIDAATGALTPILPDIDTGLTGPHYPVFDPTGQFLFIGGRTSENMRSFVFNSSDGSLTPTGAPVASGATGGSLNRIVVHPTANFLLIALSGTTNGQDGFHSFGYNATTGVIDSAETGTPYATPGAYDIGFNLAGTHVYGLTTTGVDSHLIDSMDFNSSNGQLTGGLSGMAMTYMYQLVTHPLFDWLYFSISGAGGGGGSNAIQASQMLGNGAQTLTTSAHMLNYNLTPGAYQMAIDAAGQFLYIVDASYCRIEGFSINQSNGALTSIGDQTTVSTGATCDPMYAGSKSLAIVRAAQ
ncbi:beta-propeller fold lactonase family protein [Bdellovibrionota bacterium FG-1]